MRGKQEEDPQHQVRWQALLEIHNLMIRELDLLPQPAGTQLCIYG